MQHAAVTRPGHWPRIHGHVASHCRSPNWYVVKHSKQTGCPIHGRRTTLMTLRTPSTHCLRRIPHRPCAGWLEVGLTLELTYITWTNSWYLWTNFERGSKSCWYDFELPSHNLNKKENNFTIKSPGFFPRFQEVEILEQGGASTLLVWHSVSKTQLYFPCYSSRSWISKTAGVMVCAMVYPQSLRSFKNGTIYLLNFWSNLDTWRSPARAKASIISRGNKKGTIVGTVSSLPGTWAAAGQPREYKLED